MDEFRGRRPAKRGSATVDIDPDHLRNPRSVFHVPVRSGGRISPLAATTLRPTAGSAGKENATRVDAPAEDVELLGRRRRRHWNTGEITQVEARGVPE